MFLLKVKKNKYNISILYMIFVIFIITTSSWMFHRFVKRTITNNIESQLINSTTSNMNLIKVSMFTSVKNHLRGIAEKNKEIVETIYEKFNNGLLSEIEAKNLAKEILSCQTVGREGYIYCINTSGDILFHPQQNQIDQSIIQYEFVRKQIKKKHGYLEYQWKKPGEQQERSKALYMDYFEPWDWIISVSSYYDDFLYIVDSKDIRKQILAIKFGKSGYSFILKSNGTLVVHPKLEGKNLKNTALVQQMCLKKVGKKIYPWKNPDEKTSRLKMVIFDYIPELDWIVASSAYLDEFYGPLRSLNIIFFSIMMICLSIILPITFYMKNRIFKPLKTIQNLAMHLKKNDFSKQFTEKDIKSASIEIQKLMSGINALIKGFAHFIEEVKKNGVKIFEASELIVGTLEDLSENAELTQTKANNVAGASDQMASNFSTIVTTSEQMNNSVKKVSGLSDDLSEYINKVSQQINDISQSISTVGQYALDGVKISDEAMIMSKNAHATIHSLDDATKEIGGVTQVIKRIADKTNMLALNAAIEAASAGDAGKGFSVVAGSIQKFAEQSNEAAENIAERIVNVQEKTVEAIGVIESISTIINKVNVSSETVSHSVKKQIQYTENIVDNSTKADNLSKEIVIAMDELLSGSDYISKILAETEAGASEISENINNVDESTKKSNENIQDIHQLVSDMNQMASAFQTLIAKINIK